MLFNSYTFIFAFLPVTYIGFLILGGAENRRWAIAWLIFASLFFYGWWNPKYLALLAFSILFNFFVGRWLSNEFVHRPKFKKGLLIFGVAVNLLLLCYFKYLVFILSSLDDLFSVSFSPGLTILIPLAISFFTFQQITYLVDSYRSKTANPKFLEYCLFVCFFPQLISGPIVHHKEMLPQFGRSETFKFNADNLINGSVLFVIGLFKKAVIADGLGEYVAPVFTMASEGVPVTLLESWGGITSFALQIYFDFSGYTDMAIGCAIMFGVRLPVNFDSPFKAVNRFEFWRRWHMTFARFMRNQVFLPLAHNKMIYLNPIIALSISVLLGGIWHGAGVTFIIWGFLHALFLLINHLWHRLKRRLGLNRGQSTRLAICASVLLNFLIGALAGIFFRAESIESAMVVLRGVVGLNGVVFTELPGFFGTMEVVWISALLIIVWLFPNSQQLMAKNIAFLYPGDGPHSKRLSSITNSLVKAFEFRTNIWWALFIGGLAAFSLAMMTRTERFIYFQF